MSRWSPEEWELIQRHGLAYGDPEEASQGAAEAMTDPTEDPWATPEPDIAPGWLPSPWWLPHLITLVASVLVTSAVWWLL